jgi:hypothetical protein
MFLARMRIYASISTDFTVRDLATRFLEGLYGSDKPRYRAIVMSMKARLAHLALPYTLNQLETAAVEAERELDELIEKFNARNSTQNWMLVANTYTHELAKALLGKQPRVEAAAGELHHHLSAMALSTSPACYHCGEPSHMVGECPYKDPVRAAREGRLSLDPSNPRYTEANRLLSQQLYRPPPAPHQAHAPRPQQQHQRGAAQPGRRPGPGHQGNRGCLLYTSDAADE